MQTWNSYSTPPIPVWPNEARNRQCLPTNRKLSNFFPDYADVNYFLGYTVVVDNQGTVNDIRDVLRAYDPRIQADFRPKADKRPVLNEQTLLVSGPFSDYGGGSKIEPLGSAYVELNNGFNQKDQGRSRRITVNVSDNNLNSAPVVKLWTIGPYPIPAVNAPVVAALSLLKQNGTWTGVTLIPNFDDHQVLWVAMEITNPGTIGNAITGWHYDAEIVVPTTSPTPTYTSTPSAAGTYTPTTTPTP